MNLEKQVCSLELAKQLKELGMKQESQFYHVNARSIGEVILENEIWLIAHHSQINGMSDSWLAAFTVSELGEMLPDNLCICNEHPFLFIAKGTQEENQYTIGYSTMEKSITPFYTDENEANARAKMLIYLIENKLISV